MASLLFGQSGGPTPVINASAAGVFETALPADGIDQVLGAAHGIVGILGEHLYDIGTEDPAELALLRNTPSSALGTCRYDTPMIAIVETMGRNAGRLVAATAAAADKGAGPDLIYLPEVAFDLEKFTDDVLSLAGRQQHVIAAVSEGVRTADGRYVPELAADVKTDAFGHKQMGGTAVTLANHLRNRTEIKVRGIEINLPQRAAAHWAAARDVAEAYEAGATAVRELLGGRTDVMVGFDRRSDDPYECVMTTVPLDNVANTERVVPPEWITPEQTFVTGDYLRYLYPLIAKGAQVPLEDGLPRFARLRRQRVEQRLG